MHRRLFLAMSGGALLSGARPQPRGVGYCIVGLGRISLRQFMPALKMSQKAHVAALVSGSRAKAEKTAADYGVHPKNIYNYQTYDAIGDNPDIDAVYIALPNGMHAEYSIRAARAGKHVLCEKPMANTAAECEQMLAASRKAQRKLMVAYRCQFEPTHLRAIREIREGRIGRLLVIESCFGFNIAKGEWRLNRKLAGGGPLMDVGVYSLQAARYLSGEEPAVIHASSSVITQDGRFTEVEENLVWGMRFPSGVLANCATSYGSSIGNYVRAVGSQGSIRLEPAFSYDGLRIRIQAQGQPVIEEATDDPQPRQFLREADHFADCIRENREPKAGGEDGLRDMRIVEAIYRACQQRRTIRL
jgi:predicted dehydrogenase